jgi:hypothetical protein
MFVGSTKNEEIVIPNSPIVNGDVLVVGHVLSVKRFPHADPGRNLVRWDGHHDSKPCTS